MLSSTESTIENQTNPVTKKKKTHHVLSLLFYEGLPSLLSKVTRGSTWPVSLRLGTPGGMNPCSMQESCGHWTWTRGECCP